MRSCSGKILAFLLLLLLVCSSFHCAASARVLPGVPPLLAHHENGAKVSAAAADGLVLQSAAVVSGGDELSVSEVSEAEPEEEAGVACEEGNEDCLQRRLLQNAHLDYIYTQHKGKP